MGRRPSGRRSMQPELRRLRADRRRRSGIAARPRCARSARGDPPATWSSAPGTPARNRSSTGWCAMARWSRWPGTPPPVMDAGCWKASRNVTDRPAGPDVPQQRGPWCPHVRLALTESAAMDPSQPPTAATEMEQLFERLRSGLGADWVALEPDDVSLGAGDDPRQLRSSVPLADGRPGVLMAQRGNDAPVFSDAERQLFGHLAALTETVLRVAGRGLAAIAPPGRGTGRRCRRRRCRDRGRGAGCDRRRRLRQLRLLRRHGHPARP